ncbi:MAG TPA: alkaline phosphatase, partial [Anaerolineae bacterium]|nr:alkaline phosphatase [Anaerolineae bacterium]
MLTFEVADNSDFSGDVVRVEVEVTADSDFTGKALVEGLAPGQAYSYRVTLTANGVTSEPVMGQFHTAP